VTGGYLAGGGHAPVTPIHGLGSDQILSVNIVTPDGRFVTADETQNQDLFWAIRGGGPATWGVVTSMTVKVHEKTVMSGMTWDTTTTAMNISDDTFWKAIEAYWTRYPEFSDAKSYGYCRMSALPEGGYAWRAKPFMVPGMKLVDFKKLVEPLLDDWAALGVDPQIEFFEHESLYGAWSRHFPVERVGSPYARTASRLMPRKNWEDKELMAETIKTIRAIVEEGAFLVHYNINADEPENTPESSVNPAWRDVMMFNIIGLTWDADTSEEEVAAIHDKLTNDLAQRLKDISPGAGGYLNEGDVMDPEFAQSFYGEHYDRLLEIKNRIDPKSVFWAPTAVGSEGWYVTGQEEYVTKQNGRLCPKCASNY
jgi:FAD/FMN-containing dehydrogenase